MTNQRDNIIIAEHGTITQEALLAYLNDELSVEQKQQLEQLLKSDPFSQDALEGLRSAQDKAAVSSTLIAIRKKVNERIGKREKRVIPFHWSNYAYAAVILGLLISVAFILTTYFHKHQEDIAMNKTDEQNTVVPQQQEIKQEQPVAPATTPDTVSFSATSTGTAGNANTMQDKIKKSTAGQSAGTYAWTADSAKTDGYASLAQKTTDKAKEKVSKKESLHLDNVSGAVTNNATNEVTLTESADNNATNRGQMTSSAYTVTTKNARANNNVSATSPPQGLTSPAPQTSNYFSNNAATPPTAKAKEEAAPQTNDNDAHKTFFSGDYKKSEIQYDSVLQKQPDNSDALFFGGISDYVNGDLDKAEKNFDKLLGKKKRYVDGSKWYKANILLKKGQKDAGVNLLQELAHTTGSYKERAQKKLAELQ